MPCVKQAWVETHELKPPLGDLHEKIGIRKNNEDAFASFDPNSVVSLGLERRKM